MITSDDLRTVSLFEKLSDAELTKIALASADLHLIADQFLVHEGELPAFYVLLSGELELTKWLGDAEQILNTYVSGDFFGEVPLLLGTTVFVNLRATTTVRVARMDGADFLELIMGSEPLAASILQKMAWRVNAIQEISVSTPQQRILLVGDSADLACYDLRQFLAGNRLRFQWLDPHNPDMAPLIPEHVRNGLHPAVSFPDGTHLHAPTLREVADRAGLQTAPKRDYYDVVIIGGGPAGLAAAVYGASEGLVTLLLERQAPGGQAGTSSRIENYLGFPTGLSGGELGTRALDQAKRFGAEVVVSRKVCDIVPKAGDSTVILDGGQSICARTIVLATGVAWRKLGVPGAEALVGRGIYYGAARTEAMGVRGKEVYLIGGGNSAGQAAVFFADYASEVTLLIRAPTIEAGMSQYLIDQIKTKDNIKVCLRSCVTEVHGSEQLEAITVRTDACAKDGSLDPTSPPTSQKFAADSLFVFIGADAVTDWLPDGIGRDKLGYILTGPDAHTCFKWPLERDPYLLETTVPGIFAAGDVRHASIKRVAAGVGEGSMAIAFIHQYLASLPA